MTSRSRKRLPTPRHLLTSLLNTLTTSPAPTNSTNPTNPPYSATGQPTNPLKSLPGTHRALLTTLHVLFPPPMLLQALDLLDRGLVTRLVQCAPVPPPPADRIIAAEGKEKGTEREVKPPHAHVHLPSSPPLPMEGIGVEQARQAREGKGKVEDGRRNVVYQVRSSQAMRLGRFKSNHVPGNEITAVGIGSMVYTVRLEAWNCSCAAFTFAAFPGGGSGGGYWGGKAWDSEDEDVMDRFEGSSQREWQFGGLGFDGMDLGNGEGGSGNMPICKHLLACLLGERWEGVLGSYVMVRDVGREVMAGVGGEG